MTYLDLLDLYCIFIHIRFCLDSNIAGKLLAALEKALFSNLNSVLNNDKSSYCSIRNYIAENVVVDNVCFARSSASPSDPKFHFIKFDIPEECLAEDLKNIRFGVEDEKYTNCNFDCSNVLHISLWLSIVHEINKNVKQQEYANAFRIVDSVHNYPTEILAGKKNALKKLSKYAYTICSNS